MYMNEHKHNNIKKGDIVYYYPETNRKTISRGTYNSDIVGEPDFILVVGDYPYEVSKCDIETDVYKAQQMYTEQRFKRLEIELENTRKEVAETHIKLDNVCSYLKIPSKYW